MTQNTKAMMVAAAVVVTVCFLSWCAGFDYNERGCGAFMTALYAIFLGAVGYLLAKL